MKYTKNDESTIDISKIPNASRYFFPVSYVFPGKNDSCSAFEKTNVETGFHIQEFYELCIISKGEGYHIIEDTAVKAVRGDVFIVPPGRKHALSGGKGFNVHYIHLSPKFLERNSERLKVMPAFLTLFEVEPLMRVNGAKYRHLYLDENILNEILDVLRQVDKWWNGEIIDHLVWESYVLIAVSMLCREYGKLQSIVGKNAHSDRLFMESVSTILERYNERLTIEELSQLAGLSRTAYIKRFCETVGMPPRRFIMEHRIKMAKNLLKSTDKPIAKIAEETGFYDSAHFSKCFTHSVGVSPTDYRKGGENS